MSKKSKEPTGEKLLRGACLAGLVWMMVTIVREQKNPLSAQQNP